RWSFRRGSPGPASQRSLPVSSVSLRVRALGVWRVGVGRVDGDIVGIAQRIVQLDLAVGADNAGVSGVLGQLQSPVGLVLCIDFEKPGALITPRQAILNPEYCEGFVTGAHEDRSVPGAAADIVDRKEVIEAPL